MPPLVLAVLLAAPPQLPPPARPAPFLQLIARRDLAAPAPPAPPPASPLPTLPTRFKPHQPQVDADTAVRQAIPDGAGGWWLATNLGAYFTDGDQWWQPLDQRDGMPRVDLNALHLAPNGDLWGATGDGAWRMRDGVFRYFRGTRWLPGNRVNRIWSGEPGKVWLETDRGVACIEERSVTLREKALRFEEITAARHDRRGYISGSTLKVPGQPDKGVVHEASDNDGLWTALHVAAESFRHAATKDPKAKSAADKSLDALLDLERLTGIAGYPARAVLTDDEIKAGTTGFDPNETVRTAGDKDKIWFRSPVEPSVWCKGDTSSDEIDGHYFAWYIYSALVDDPARKARIAATCKRVTDHILAHDFTLVGHNGKRTLWGMWNPQVLNDSPFWQEERGLNSIELLCYLKVAAHLTGEQRYSDLYDDLIRKHHLLANTLLYRRGLPWWGINHSDDELAYTAYWPLLRLETDPDRRRVLVRSIASGWEPQPGEQSISAEASPFYNFLYGTATGRPCDIESAVRTLEDWPWELVNHDIDNTTRLDVVLRHAPGGGRNRTSTDRVLPASERRVMRWNGSPWEAVSGGGAASEEDGTAFLLPYWLGVWAGYIDKDR